MTIEEAKQMMRDYYNNNEKRTVADEYAFIEAMEFLIEETHDPVYMHDLAWYYCTKKRHDLELEYMELAASYNYGPAFCELGYMWYYGQHGHKDYKKAFEYYSKGAECPEYSTSMYCKYKLADMYRFGCYVEKDEARYRTIIEEAFEDIRLNVHYTNEPYPEIAYRYACIKIEDGKYEEAANILISAKNFMADRLLHDFFWGHLEVMGRIIRTLYSVIDFDEEFFDFYDLFYLMDGDNKVEFYYKDKKQELIIEKGEETCNVCFNGKWFQTPEDFYAEAKVDDKLIMTQYDELYGFKVVI